jgi:hypothetical protein
MACAGPDAGVPRSRPGTSSATSLFATTDLIEPFAPAAPARNASSPGGADAGVGDLHPKRARITSAGG